MLVNISSLGFETGAGGLEQWHRERGSRIGESCQCLCVSVWMCVCLCGYVCVYMHACVCVPHPSSEVRLCVSVVSSMGSGGGVGSMSTKCSEAEWCRKRDDARERPPGGRIHTGTKVNTTTTLSRIVVLYHPFLGEPSGVHIFVLALH